MTSSSGKTTRPAALFLLSCAWLVLALGAGREMSGLVPALWQDFARLAGAALLLFTGFYFMGRSQPDMRPLSSVGLVLRPGIATEFGVGAAVGWGIAIALVLPAMLTGNLSLTFSWDATALTRMLLSAAMLAAFAAVVQLVLAGLPMRMLVASVGPTWATVAVIFVCCCMALAGQAGEGSSLLFVALAAGLFCAAYLRTRAIWLPLGLQIGWTVGLQLLFGANSPYEPPGYGIVQSDSGGPAWLTGGPFGPEASLAAMLVLIGAIIVLFRVTRDYAWHYTYKPIEGAAHAVVVAPPAEHVKEEAKFAAVAPLVQIGGLPTTPAPSLKEEAPSPPDPML